MAANLISIETMIERYQAGESSESIATDAGVSSRHVRRLLAKHGVELRKTNRYRKYEVNVAFFKEWSSKMAYVLGFIYADAHLTASTSHYRLSITQKDEETLRMVAKEMGCAENIQTFHDSKHVPVLHVNSKDIVEDLLSLGIPTTKAEIRKFPNVPDEYLSHFVRGIYDGDGHLMQESLTVVVIPRARALSQRLEEIWRDMGLNMQLKENNGSYRIWVSGYPSVQQLYDWLYKGAGRLYAKQKRRDFQQFVDELYLKHSL